MRKIVWRDTVKQLSYANHLLNSIITTVITSTMIRIIMSNTSLVQYCCIYRHIDIQFRLIFIAFEDIFQSLNPLLIIWKSSFALLLRLWISISRLPQLFDFNVPDKHITTLDVCFIYILLWAFMLLLYSSLSAAAHEFSIGLISGDAVWHSFDVVSLKRFWSDGQ